MSTPINKYSILEMANAIDKAMTKVIDSPVFNEPYTYNKNPLKNDAKI